MKVYAGILKVMNGVSSIGKDRSNSAQGYKFRGIDDVYNDLHSLFADAGLFCVSRVVDDRSEDRQNKNGGTLIYRILSMEFDIMADDGSKVTFGPFIGEGMDSGDKASNKAMSVAQKYFLLQTFLVPTEDAKDPENDSPAVSPRAQAMPPKPQTPAPSVPAPKPVTPAPKDGKSSMNPAVDIDVMKALSVVCAKDLKAEKVTAEVMKSWFMDKHKSDLTKCAQSYIDEIIKKAAC